MEFKLVPIFTFVSVTLALVAISYAALSPDAYWKSVLPNTPMPKAVEKLVHPEWMEDKSTSVGVGKGGIGADTGNPGKRTNVGVGKGGVSVSTGKKGKPVYVGVKPGPNSFTYNYAATKDQLHDDPNTALFFLEKDMTVGKKMTLHFTKTSQSTRFGSSRVAIRICMETRHKLTNPTVDNKNIPKRHRWTETEETTKSTTLLPRPVADKIPFSSEKFSQILDHFSLKPNSVEAEIMNKTIKECEEPVIKGEEKFCATSLESMIDFSTSKLGKKVSAISTEVGKESKEQKYSIIGVKIIPGDKTVVCHKQNYAYAVFYCHKSHTTEAYVVSLAGADGTRAKAVAICHSDTSAWNPKHLAFQVLKVKPGTVPVCHVLTEDQLIWVPKS